MKLLFLVWVALAIVVAGGIGISAVRNDGTPDLDVLTVGLMLLAVVGGAVLKFASSIRNR